MFYSNCGWSNFFGKHHYYMDNYRSRIYKYYNTTWHESELPRSLADFKSRAPTMRHIIKRFFPKDKSASILDLGCGHGTLLYFAQRSGYLNIVGVDISNQQVALANHIGISGVFQGDLVETLKATPSNSLDTVIAFDVIEHFNKCELLTLVDAVYAALRPGGTWVIHAPNANSPFVGTVRYGDFTHEQAFTPNSISQLLKASGFRKVTNCECSPNIHGIFSLIRYFLWKFFRAFLVVFDASEAGWHRGKGVWTRNFYSVAVK